MLRRHAIALVCIAAAATPALAQSGAPAPAPAPAAAPATPRRQLPNDSLQIARRYVAWLWSSQVDSLLAHAPPDTTANRREQMTSQIAQMIAQIGVEEEVLEEKWVRRNGNRQYWRTGRYSDFRQEPLVLRLVLLPDGQMGGIGLNQQSQLPPIDAEP